MEEDSFLQKVLVAYNGSKASLKAVMYSFRMAKAIDCAVKVVVVADVSSVTKLNLIKMITKEEAESGLEWIERDAKVNINYVKNLALQNQVQVETEIRHGSIWSEIVLAADEWDADLILLGSETVETSNARLHSEISYHSREIIGSAHCNVMVVK